MTPLSKMKTIFHYRYKTKNALMFSVFILTLGTIFYAGIFTQNLTPKDVADDLIKIQRINERAILVSFGYEAVTAVLSSEGIVVIDAGISNTLTAKYRKIIEKEFPGEKFIYLINTHSHWDHTGGNQVFNDAQIIGHENCRSEMKQWGKNIDESKKNLLKIVDEYETELRPLKKGSDDWNETYTQIMRFKSAYNDLCSGRVVTFPDKTFADEMNLNAGDINVKMMYFGRAHTGSDILIHFPELKLLFMGDLFFHGGRPSLGKYDKEDVKQWRKAEQWIKERLKDIETVIGGHGQLMNKKDLTEFCKFIDKN